MQPSPRHWTVEEAPEAPSHHRGPASAQVGGDHGCRRGRRRAGGPQAGYEFRGEDEGEACEAKPEVGAWGHDTARRLHHKHATCRSEILANGASNEGPEHGAGVVLSTQSRFRDTRTPRRIATRELPSAQSEMSELLRGRRDRASNCLFERVLRGEWGGCRLDGRGGRRRRPGRRTTGEHGSRARSRRDRDDRRAGGDHRGLRGGGRGRNRSGDGRARRRGNRCAHGQGHGRRRCDRRGRRSRAMREGTPQHAATCHGHQEPADSEADEGAPTAAAGRACCARPAGRGRSRRRYGRHRGRDGDGDARRRGRPGELGPWRLGRRSHRLRRLRRPRRLRRHGRRRRAFPWHAVGQPGQVLKLAALDVSRRHDRLCPLALCAGGSWSRHSHTHDTRASHCISVGRRTTVYASQNQTQ
jgi:hypothetical protein